MKSCLVSTVQMDYISQNSEKVWELWNKFETDITNCTLPEAWGALNKYVVQLHVARYNSDNPLQVKQPMLTKLCLVPKHSKAELCCIKMWKHPYHVISERNSSGIQACILMPFNDFVKTKGLCLYSSPRRRQGNLYVYNFRVHIIWVWLNMLTFYTKVTKI